LLTHNIGTSLQDLKHNYTIDQIYLFFEKCKKEELASQKMDAIILANALVYTSPSMSTTDSSKKRRAWNKFMDSLTWNKIRVSDKKPDPDALKMLFSSLGVKPKKKDVKT
jgi:hypothetical protein